MDEAILKSNRKILYQKLNNINNDLEILSENIIIFKNLLNNNFQINDKMIEADNIINLETSIKEAYSELEETIKNQKNI